MKSGQTEPGSGRVTVALVLAILGFLASAATVFAAPVEGVAKLGCIVRIFNCDETLSSAYAKVAGIPLGVFGAFYFAIWGLSLRAWQRSGVAAFLWPVSWAVTIGAVLTVALIAVLAFVVKSSCFYCLITHVCNLGAFILLWPLFRWRLIRPLPTDWFRTTATLAFVALLLAGCLYLGGRVRELTGEVKSYQETIW